MKRKLNLLMLILMLLLPGVMSFAQNYKPFISESKQWNYVQTLYLTGNGEFSC